MRSHAGKIGLLFLALVIALGGLGVGLAAWTDAIHLQGTVETADINWEVVDPSCWCQCPNLCQETAWALCDWPVREQSGWCDESAEPEQSADCDDCDSVGIQCVGWCFHCKTGWGQYFKYNIGDSLPLPLVAGQNTQIGTVSVSTSGDNIIVEYNVTAADWTLSRTHLYLKKSKPRSCAPGQFPYSSEKDPGVIISPTVHRYVIPRSNIRESCHTIFVAAHADVEYPCQSPQLSGCPNCIRALSSMEINFGGVDNIVNCPPPTPTPTPTPTPPPCTCVATAAQKTVTVNVYNARPGCSGELTFYIHNTGTIPIKVSDIIIQAPAGVVAQLLTPEVIGTQLHPSERVFCKVGYSITSSGSFTFTVTADAVQWNLYP